jgi:ferrous iron transport protein A
MHVIFDLSKLEPGKRAFVLDISSNEKTRRRLQDIGLIMGTEVSCVQKSPLGDPKAYLIRGAVIALRHEDSSCVKVHCEE